MISKIGKVRKISKVARLDEVQPAPKPLGETRISVRVRELGKREDPLEAAALQGVVGTLPQRIIWKWLEDGGYLYQVEQAVMGGRELGGAVLDFLVSGLASMLVVLRIQGDYWHGPAFPQRQARDDEQAERLRDQGYLVVDLWEKDIYEAVLFERLTRYILGEVGR